MKIYHKILLLIGVIFMSVQGIDGKIYSVLASENKNTYSKSKPKSLPKVSVTLKQLSVRHTNYPFRDISHSIYKNYINELYRREVTTGYSPTIYNPDGKVTRGEMAVFLYRIAGSPNYTPLFNVFKDVTQYKKQILWLSATTITRGTGLHYNPNGKVTRGEMAAFLHRMAVVSGKDIASKKYTPYFSDTKNHMFVNDIGWLRTQEITTGYTPTLFKPDADITRGEMAAFLWRFYNKFNRQSEPVDKTSLEVKNSTLVVNNKWVPQDNFVRATDKKGDVVSFSHIKVSGNVDTSKAGTYTVTYSYSGKVVQATIVVENRSSITLKESTITKGLTVSYGEKELRDNIIGLTNKLGEDILVVDKDKVQITATDKQGQKVLLNDITKQAGTYTVTYCYDGIITQATMIVRKEANQIVIHDIFIPKNDSNLEKFKAHILNRLLYKDQTINVREFNIKKSEVTCDYYGKTLVGETALRYIVRGNTLHSTLSTLGSPRVTYDGEYIDTIEYSYSSLWTEGFIEKIVIGYDEAMKTIKKDDSDFAKIAKLHDWIVKNVSYGMSKGHADFAAGALADRSAVCGGYAHAYEFLLEQVGIQTIYIAANTMNGPHAWNLVQLDGHWFHVDCTWDRGLGVNPSINRTYFLLNDNEFNQDGKHTYDWKNSGRYPENGDYIIDNKFYKDYKDVITDDEIRNNSIKIIRITPTIVK